jgi:hypothetical protein
MVCAGLAVGVVFTWLGAEPVNRAAGIAAASVRWDAAAVANLATIIVMVVLGVRFLSTGGVPMLRMMEAMPGDHAHHEHVHDGHAHVDGSR